MDGKSDDGSGNGGNEASGVEFQAGGDGQGGCYDGARVGRVEDGRTRKWMRGSRGHLSKIDGGSRTISEQEKQYDESGRDKTGRTGRNNVELGILDDNQPGWIFLDVIASSGLDLITFDRPLLSDSLLALHNLPRKLPALHSFLCTSDLASLAPLVDLYPRSGPLFPHQNLREGMRTGRRVCMDFDGNSCFCFFRNGIFCNTISSFCSDESIRPKRYGCRPCSGTG